MRGTWRRHCASGEARLQQRRAFVCVCTHVHARSSMQTARTQEGNQKATTRHGMAWPAPTLRPRLRSSPSSPIGRPLTPTRPPAHARTHAHRLGLKLELEGCLKDLLGRAQELDALQQVR